jgi:hypothetical protein
MVRIECQSFVFDGRMTVAEEDAPELDHPENYFGGSGKRTGHVQYGTPRCIPGMIRIGAPKIVFTATVTARGDGNIRAWTAGFLQAITEARWGARYSDGKCLWWRLNTTNGPLNDGYDGTLFKDHDRRFSPTEEARLYVATDDDHDRPGQMFFKEYSGDPFRPDRSPDGGPLGKLVRTEGRMLFNTYLAAVNHGTKSVVTLDEVRWTLTWDGTYDFETSTWASDDISGFLRHERLERAARHENLTAASKTPFSLYVETARKSWEVDAGGEGWIPWKNNLPTRDASDRPTLEKWVT